MVFSTNFVVDTKVQNSSFGNVSNAQSAFLSLLIPERSFKMLKYTEKVILRCLDLVKKEILFPQIILDKGL